MNSEDKLCPKRLCENRCLKSMDSMAVFLNLAGVSGESARLLA